MDDIAREEIMAWLRKARRDMDSAERLLADNPPYRDTAAYHCQQAGEKAIKAMLTAAGLNFPKTHDLTMLVNLAAGKFGDMGAMTDAAIILTPYATLYRYPGAALEPDDTDIQEALEAAKAMLEGADRILGLNS